MRVPFVLANWKMTMTQNQTREYVTEFSPLVSDLLGRMDIVLCPPFTGIFPLQQAIGKLNIQIGAQNLHPGPEETYTGEVSAPLLADSGAKWVMLGHSERRRTLFETDDTVHLKVLSALSNNLRPVLLIGEPIGMYNGTMEFLNQKMSTLLYDLTPEQAASMVIMYEPEEAVGVADTVSPQRIADACGFIRRGISTAFGSQTSEVIRVVYGGSVNPDNAQTILKLDEVDGLGASRFGRNAKAFAVITRQVASLKGIC